MSQHLVGKTVWYWEWS